MALACSSSREPKEIAHIQSLVDNTCEMLHVTCALSYGRVTVLSEKACEGDSDHLFKFAYIRIENLIRIKKRI